SASCSSHPGGTNALSGRSIRISFSSGSGSPPISASPPLVNPTSVPNPTPPEVVVLLGPGDVARSPDHQVAKRDLDPAAERLVPRDRREPLVRLLGQLSLRREEEVRERPLVAAPDAPAQLVHLRE